MLLDLVLPGADGIELMRTLPALADLPVVFISAYGRGDTAARALEAGAADYIVKPFSAAELVARVGLAPCRRTAPAPFVLGDLAIDRAKRRVTRPVRLTATEYRLLHALSLDAGGATTYESLLRRVWKTRVVNKCACPFVAADPAADLATNPRPSPRAGAALGSDQAAGPTGGRPRRP